jgi:ribosomal protein S18 acetylase RimI-like enzyme
MMITVLKRHLPPALRRRLRAAADLAWSDVEAVITEKDIACLEEKDLKHPACNAEIVEVGEDFDLYIAGLQREDGTLGTRKAREYLRRGFRGYAAVRAGAPIGVVWSVRRTESRLACTHPDLRWFRLGLAEDEAYMFDMYVEPEQRGLSMCTALFRAGFRALRAQGVTRVKGYYETSNLPALWMHRMAGYREVGRVRVRRVFGMTWSYEYTALALRASEGGASAPLPASARARANVPVAAAK